MQRQSLVAWTLAAGVAATLSGCYVVPIDPRYPYDPAHPYAAQGVPAGLPIQSVPVTLQARLYPVNDIAGRVGALNATVVDTLNGHATFGWVFAKPFAFMRACIKISYRFCRSFCRRR